MGELSMRRLSDHGGCALIALMVGAFLAAARIASAQSLGELNQRLDQLQAQVNEGVSNPDAASEVIDRLDEAEAEFARIEEGGHADRDGLIAAYERLEPMLERMHQTYARQKEACVTAIGKGSACDYDKSEQLALRALYPLSWLRFAGAQLYADEPATARKLLNQAIDGFTDSSLVILSPELVRENLLGRAISERELGKWDHAEYARAVADFKRIMRDGPGSRQYRAAEKGLAATYAAMGKLAEAQRLTARMAENASGDTRQGLEMLHLREMFRAESAAVGAAQRADQHRQIVDFIRARESNRDSWAVAVAAVAQYVSDPIGEFGGANDAFENWLLANVLYYKHQPLDAAKYYWAAARSGKYSKAYKYAADLYYLQGRLEMVEKVADEIARQPGNADAQWAAYMRFKIPRVQWERGAMKNAQLENAWVAGAREYLKNYPRGNWAFEPRFRLGELAQRKGDYLDAAAQYEQVSGNPGYDFTARFNAAECYFAVLTGKVAKGEAHAPAPLAPADRERIRRAAIATMRDAIGREPVAERAAASAQRRAFNESRGRAIYMLASMLVREPRRDYREIASMLTGYERQYPSLSNHFDEIYEWRVTALDQTAQYAALEREARALVARDAANPAHNDYIKEIGLDFWKSARAKLAAGDRQGYAEDAKFTAITYEYFERMVTEGKIPAKNLTGTLSILGQAYLALNDAGRAAAVFSQVVKADPGSPDATAGLARIAQGHKNYAGALDLWSRVETVAAESDPLYYEARYNMAEIFAQEGNLTSACGKLAATSREHPNLGSPDMKAQWSALQSKVCPNHTQG
jgi:TolA-binding protein